MYPTTSASQTLIAFGLMELDTSGNVIRYCSEGCESIAANRETVVGRNFFTDIVPNESANGLKARFDRFISPGHDPFEKIERRYDLAGQRVRVQLLFSRNAKCSSTDSDFLVLARITPSH